MTFIESKIAKSIYFVIGLAIIAFVTVYILQHSKLAASINSPSIAFNELKHDFGRVPEGPQIQYSFRFKNAGAQMLKIENIQTSCGCTGATSGAKTEFQKGESGEITVTFNTQGRDGKQEKTIIIKTNDPSNEQIILTITCLIDKEMK